jgi:cytochrome d ubiquinol oxidase subunit II
MTTIWYLLLGFMLIAFAILDGMNLGAGAMHLVLGRNNDERRTHFAAVGPLWWGYEVWLLAAGGSMVSAFPILYAKSFSGFYLVLTLVLWMLIIRGTAIEFRQQVDNDLWRGFWDACYCVSSVLLAVLFGAAVGNVIRGVPFNSHLDFTGSFGLALNPYAILIGVLSLAYLSMHGAIFIALKTAIAEHFDWAIKVAGVLFVAVVVLIVLATGLSFPVRPDLATNYVRYPVLFVLPILTLVGIIGIGSSIKGRNPSRALAASAITLAAMMASAGASLYPSLLPNLGQATGGLTIANTSAPEADLQLAAVLNIAGIVAVICYAAYVHKVFGGTVNIYEEDHAY